MGTKDRELIHKVLQMCPAKGRGDKNSLKSTPASQAKLSALVESRVTHTQGKKRRKKGGKRSLILIHTGLGKGAFTTLFDGVYKCELTLCRYLVMFGVPIKRL